MPITVSHPRSGWQNPLVPISGPSFEWWDVDQIVFHYTAAVDLPDGDLGEHQYDIPPYLRNIQAWYVRDRGYSIGYNYAVDWLGGFWELRGDTFESAATAGVNGHSVAVLCLVDSNDRVTREAVQTIHRFVTEARQMAGRHLRLVGHNHPVAKYHSGSTTSTSCPGTGVRAQLAEEVFEPGGALPPPTPSDPSFDPANGKYSLWPLNQAKPNIREGSTGDAVKYAQGVMAYVKKYAITVDGKFGPETKRFVTQLQTEHMRPDQVGGGIGPDTWKVIDLLAFSKAPIPTPPPAPTPTPVPTEGDVSVLCVAKLVNDGPFFMSVAPLAGAYHVPTELPRELISMGAYDVGSKKRVTSWGQCTPVTKAAALAVLGPER